MIAYLDAISVVDAAEQYGLSVHRIIARAKRGKIITRKHRNRYLYARSSIQKAFGLPVTEFPQDDEALLSTELMEMFDFSHDHVWRLLKKGAIESRKSGFIWIVSRQSAESYKRVLKPLTDVQKQEILQLASATNLSRLEISEHLHLDYEQVRGALYNTAICVPKHSPHKDKVVAIREDYATGQYSYYDMAEKYDVSFNQIAKIVTGESHSCLPGPTRERRRYSKP